MCMRTTIELTDKQRARLLDLAAQRGLKGFSALVQEAVDRYLDEAGARHQTAREAIAVLGTFDDEEADALRESMRRARGNWR